MRIIAWAGFLILLLCNLADGYWINHIDKKDFKIVKLELACKAEGKKYISYLAENQLLRTATINTEIDCLFIIFYVIILISLSSRQMQSQKSIALNSLLRLNIFLAVVTGLLDYVENSILFIDYHLASTTCYMSTHYVSSIKFVLAAWILAIWLISVIRNASVK